MEIKKFFLIAFKDLKLIYRDPSALVLMLLAPFVLTLGMGLLTGRFSGSGNTGINEIPVVIVDNDRDQLGEVLVDVFQSEELADLVQPSVVEDEEQARTMVDENQASAAIIIPEAYSQSILAIDYQAAEGELPQIEFYSNPTAPTSVGVVRSILDQFVNEVEVGRVRANVIIQQLLENGLITPQQVPGVVEEVVGDIRSAERETSAIMILGTTAEGTGIEFDILSYMAPGMAIMFLMYTVTYGGRSLLVENRMGTLPRLLVAPTSAINVLGGKGFGIFLVAITQLLILIGGTTLLFRLAWGDPLGVLLLILAAAFGATGWGLIFAAILKTPGQVAITGSATMLLFGILGGSFFDLSMLPDWIQVVNKITPNAWAIDGFYILSVGGKLADIVPHLIALVVMGLVLFAVASYLIRRRGLVAK
jgi:ABC-2 type transport system permease protein